ncbi:MAG: anti-sigma factor family protein [Gemmatimonadales bacterium]
MTSRLDRYTCDEALRRLDDYVDRELAEAELRRVREHLETCAACSERFKLEAGVLDQLKDKLRRIAMPPDLMARIRHSLGRSDL